VTVAEDIDYRTRSKTWAPAHQGGRQQDLRHRRRRHHHRHRPREFIFPEGLRALPAARPEGPRPRIQKASIRSSRSSTDRRGDRPKDSKSITEVATISANNDRDRSRGDEKVGATNGSSPLRRQNGETAVTVVRDAVRPRLPVAAFRQQRRSRHCEFDNPYILIFEEKVSTVKSLIPLLEWPASRRTDGSQSPRTSRARRWPRSC